MFAFINNSFPDMPERKKWFTLAMILAGILFPWFLLIPLLLTHGAWSNVVDFTPLLYGFLSLAAVSMLVFLVSVTALYLKSHRYKRSRFPLVIIQVVSGFSIILTIALAAFVSLPQLIRSGDTPPQLILTGSRSEMPEVVVVFWTRYKTANTLEWGPVDGTLKTETEMRSLHHHWFQLEGLEPGRLYKYAVNGQEFKKFSAPPAAGKPLRFAAAGDPHFGNPQSNNALTARMLDYIKDPANGYSMLCILGDCAHLGFCDFLWKDAFNTISDCSSSIPTCFVIGNHDTLFGGLNLYQDYLCKPTENDEKGRCLWKRIDNGNIHFLVLDMEWDVGLFTAEQQAWLVNQLESIPPDDWCIVLNHTFYYCSGSYMEGWAWYDNRGTIAKLTPLFEKYGVDLVMSGHKHQSEVLQKNGVTYVIMGSFGGPPDGQREYISPASIWYRAGVYGFADVTIEGNVATIIIRDHENRELYRKAIDGD